MTSVVQSKIVSAAEITQNAPTHNAQKSSWKGFHVQTMAKGAVNIANMAEEVALSLASFGSDKSIKEKKDEQKKVQRVKSELIPGMPTYEADVFVRALNQQDEKDAQSCLELVKKFYRDPTMQDAALRYAKEHLPEGDALRAEIDFALEQLSNDAGPEIRAGYNISTVEHGDLSPQEARDCYRFHVLNYGSYEKTFKNLLEEYNPEELPNTIEFLRKALGADMQSLQPSCAPAELHEVAEGLYVVQNLGSLYKEAGKMCKSVGDRFGTNEPHPRNVMQGILLNKDMLSVAEATLRRSMSYLISRNPSRDAVFVRGAREIARNLPLKMYPSEEQRQRLLTAFQQNLDKAIEREEELEE